MHQPKTLIDKHDHDKIVKANGEWRAHLNNKSFLAGEDKAALAETATHKSGSGTCTIYIVVSKVSFNGVERK